MSFEFTWWEALLIFLYIFFICFGIGFFGGYGFMISRGGSEPRNDSRFKRIHLSFLFALLGGFVNLGIVSLL
jgi:hypothetical protein